MDHPNGIGPHSGRDYFMIRSGIGNDYGVHGKVFVVLISQSCANGGHGLDFRNVFFTQVEVKRLKENSPTQFILKMPRCIFMGIKQDVGVRIDIECERKSFYVVSDDQIKWPVR